jgi:arylsulfatase A-like enzyme
MDSFRIKTGLACLLLFLMWSMPATAEFYRVDLEQGSFLMENASPGSEQWPWNFGQAQHQYPETIRSNGWSHGELPESKILRIYLYLDGQTIPLPVSHMYNAIFESMGSSRFGLSCDKRKEPYCIARAVFGQGGDRFAVEWHIWKGEAYQTIISDEPALVDFLLENIHPDMKYQDRTPFVPLRQDLPMYFGNFPCEAAEPDYCIVKAVYADDRGRRYAARWKVTKGDQLLEVFSSEKGVVDYVLGEIESDEASRQPFIQRKEDNPFMPRPIVQPCERKLCVVDAVYSDGFGAKYAAQWEQPQGEEARRTIFTNADVLYSYLFQRVRNLEVESNFRVIDVDALEGRLPSFQGGTPCQNKQEGYCWVNAAFVRSDGFKYANQWQVMGETTHNAVFTADPGVVQVLESTLSQTTGERQDDFLLQNEVRAPSPAWIPCRGGKEQCSVVGVFSESGGQTYAGQWVLGKQNNVYRMIVTSDEKLVKHLVITSMLNMDVISTMPVDEEQEFFSPKLLGNTPCITRKQGCKVYGFFATQKGESYAVQWNVRDGDAKIMVLTNDPVIMGILRKDSPRMNLDHKVPIHSLVAEGNVPAPFKLRCHTDADCNVSSWYVQEDGYTYVVRWMMDDDGFHKRKVLSDNARIVNYVQKQVTSKSLEQSMFVEEDIIISPPAHVKQLCMEREEFPCTQRSVVMDEYLGLYAVEWKIFEESFQVSILARDDWFIDLFSNIIMDKKGKKEGARRWAGEALAKMIRAITALFASPTSYMIVVSCMVTVLAKVYASRLMTTVDTGLWLGLIDVIVYLGLASFLAVLEHRSLRFFWFTIPFAIFVMVFAIANSIYILMAGEQAAWETIIDMFDRFDEGMMLLFSVLARNWSTLGVIFAGLLVLPVFLRLILKAMHKKEEPFRLARSRAVIAFLIAISALSGRAFTGPDLSLGSISPELLQLSRNLWLRVIQTFTLDGVDQPGSFQGWGQNPLVTENVTLEFREQKNRPNVLFVVLESTRFDYTSLAGASAKAHTPELARLAEAGVQASTMRALVPHTSKSMFSVLCGRFPVMIRKRVESWDNISADCLPAFLGRSGYSTLYMQSSHGVFESRPRLISKMGFQNFMAWEDIQGDPIGYFSSEDLSLEGPFFNWVDSLPRKKPFFATLLTSATHEPYGRNHHRFSGEELTDPERYGKLVETSDELLGRIVSGLEDRGMLSNTLLVVFGDHGEGFGEHVVLFHDNNYFEEVLRVPFVMAGPGITPDVIDGNSSLLDIVPTVMAALGVEPSADSGLQGYNLLAGEHLDVGPRYFNCFTHLRCQGFVLDNRKVVFIPQDVESWFYDLDADPDEGVRLPLTPDLEEELKRMLDLMAMYRPSRNPEAEYGEFTLDNWWCIKRDSRCLHYHAKESESKYIPIR